MPREYSLQDLAWLSRCLFCDDFEAELLAMGVSPEDARMLWMHLAANKRDNILNIYQAFLGAPSIVKILDQYCYQWIQKQKKKGKVD